MLYSLHYDAVDTGNIHLSQLVSAHSTSLLSVVAIIQLYAVLTLTSTSLTTHLV